jgi:hypothetical protein
MDRFPSVADADRIAAFANPLVCNLQFTPDHVADLKAGRRPTVTL